MIWSGPCHIHTHMTVKGYESFHIGESY